MLRWSVFGAIVGVGAMLSGCGYTDFEMAAKQRQIDALVAELHAVKSAPAPACGVDVKHASPAAARPVLSSR